MNVVLAAPFVAAGGLLLLRWRRPVWYWRAFGGPVAVARVRWRWASVMEACELVVAPSRVRRALARVANRPFPRPLVPRLRRVRVTRTGLALRVALRPLVPRLRRVRVTRTGLALRVALRPGQDAFDFAAAADRLRHSFAMHQVTTRELRAGVVELRMTAFDVLRRVHVPRTKSVGGLRVPVALCEDGSVFVRDYRKVPHALTIGATQSGKSVYQRGLVKELAPVPGVALVGIDCKRVELAPLARRFSALVDTPDDALELLEALVSRMEDIYELIRAEQRISAEIPDAEIAADIWALPADKRPVPVVVIVDEVAELALVSSGTKDEEARRDRIVTLLVRLAQLGRAAGIFLEICGQRFGADLGKGITMLRAQLTERIVHRVNDEGSAKMALGDIAPAAVAAATQISPKRPGTAVAATSAGGWRLLRTAPTTMRQAADACAAHAHLTPDLSELSRWRPANAGVSLIKPVPGSVTEAA